MGTHVTKNEITFNPMFTYKDGSRSFAIEDITETDYQILEKTKLDRLPLALRSLISDILWTQRKNYPASQIAAQSYWETFQQVYKVRKYYEALNPLKEQYVSLNKSNFKRCTLKYMIGSVILLSVKLLI